MIHGNNTGDLYALTQLAHKPGGIVRFHGMDAGIELPAGASSSCITPTTRGRWPPPATGTWCCGHSHKIEIAEQKNCTGGTTTWSIRAPSAASAGPATWVLADLATMHLRAPRGAQITRIPRPGHRRTCLTVSPISMPKARPIWSMSATRPSPNVSPWPAAASACRGSTLAMILEGGHKR